MVRSLITFVRLLFGQEFFFLAFLYPQLQIFARANVAAHVARQISFLGEGTAALRASEESKLFVDAEVGSDVRQLFELPAAGQAPEKPYLNTCSLVDAA
jgi:hypothetical protein